MKSWVERLLGRPVLANVTMPFVFDSFTGSSLMLADFQAELTLGSPWIPNWTMKPLTARKKATSWKKPILTRL